MSYGFFAQMLPLDFIEGARHSPTNSPSLQGLPLSAQEDGARHPRSKDMYAYICLGTRDVERAGAFYDPVLATLGLHRCSAQETPDIDGWVGWARGAIGTPERPELWLCNPAGEGPSAPGNGVMVALSAGTKGQVQRFHAAALTHGGTSEGLPGFRPQYGEGFYAAYIRDPDGNKLAAVFTFISDGPSIQEN